MPLPQDDTLPEGNQPGASTSTTVDGADAENIIEKFRQLGEDAAAEEDDDDGEDDEEHEGLDKDAVAGEGVTEGAGGEGKKKKKKKKKGKASKAVDRLKWVDVESCSLCALTLARTITTGQAPQELVEMVRQNMDPQDQNATDGELSERSGSEESSSTS